MVHQYIMNGYRIVVDVGSGNIHVMDEPAYDTVRLMEEGCKGEQLFDRLRELYPALSDAEIGEVLSDVEALIEKGQLFASDPYEGIVRSLQTRKPVLKALCLLVSQGCNLNCTYCFASQGHFQKQPVSESGGGEDGGGADASGSSGTVGQMSFATGKQALDFLVAHSGTRRNLEVDFFGGEPLLNFEVCQQLVRYARSIEGAHGKHFRFTLTTNGVGITEEVIRWANAECYNVVLSLDGRKEVHDRFRKDFSGKGSYDRVVPLFQRFVKAREGKQYYMRGTYSHFNTDFTKDIFHMADALGFRELSMEPVVAGPGEEYALTEEDLPTLYAEYERLAVDMLRRERAGSPITFYHYMLDLSEGPCIYKRVSGCGSGTEYLCVTADGRLYPCHQFVSDADYCLGDVWQGITTPKIQEAFQGLNLYTRPACADCWARLYCAGGCSANALHMTGQLDGNYALGCALFRKRLECAIMLQVARSFSEAGEEAEMAAVEER